MGSVSVKGFRRVTIAISVILSLLVALCPPVHGQSRAYMSGDLLAQVQQVGPEGQVPVLIRFRTPLEQVDWHGLEAVTGVGVAVGDRFPAINAVAARVPAARMDALAGVPEVERVEYDAPLHVDLSSANAWYGTKQARLDYGFDGSGVTIAVVDTGIDGAHADLSGKVVGWKDFLNGRADPYDDHGHGTHVAGIAAGTGAASGGTMAGVAPGARLVGLKACDLNGACATSTVVAAVQWAIDNRQLYNIRVINLSLSSTTSSDGTDSLSAIVNKAADANIVPVTAAGNNGPRSYTIGSPAAAAQAITVGAMADVARSGFYLASYSGRGPTADGRVKPDIVAPGTNIQAPAANTGTGYAYKSGTSMASPFVAGTVALMLQANPGLTPAQVKSLLATTAVDWGAPGPDNEYGYGRLDGYAAVQAAAQAMAVTAVQVPDHRFWQGQLAGAGDRATYSVSISNTALPLAITLIAPGWSASGSPNFQVQVLDPGGSQAGASSQDARQDTLTVYPSVTGTYTVVVTSVSGSGAYWLDLSAGLGTTQPPPAATPPSAWSSGDLEASTWTATGSGGATVAKDYAFTAPAFTPAAAKVTVTVSDYRTAGSDGTDGVRPSLQVWTTSGGADGSLIGTLSPAGTGTYALSSQDPAVLAALSGGTAIRLKVISLDRKSGKLADRVSVSAVQVDLTY